MSSSGDNASSPEEFGDLYRESAGDSSRAEDQDTLTWNEPRAPSERKPRRNPGVDHRSGGRFVELRRHLETSRSGNDRALRHRPVGRTGTGEIHQAPVLKTTDPVYAAHGGQGARAGIVRAVRHPLIDGLQRRGAHVDQHLVLARNGLRELLKPGRLSQVVKHGGVQVRSPVIRRVSFQRASIPPGVNSAMNSWMGRLCSSLKPPDSIPASRASPWRTVQNWRELSMAASERLSLRVD